MERSLMAIVSDKGVHAVNGFLECLGERLTLLFVSQCVM